MPPTESELLRLAITAHEAAADPVVWPQFLEHFAKAVDADITFIQRHYFVEERSTHLVTFGISQRLSESYNRYYSRINVWRQKAHARGLYAEGRVLTDEEMYPRALLKRTEFYNDCLVPIRATQCVSAVIARRRDEALVLAMMRDEPRESFGTSQTQTIERLLPHVIRAYVTQERLQALEAGEAVLDTLSVGVLLLAQDGRVVFCNRAGEGIVRAGDGLFLHNERLAASESGVQSKLQRMLLHAASPGESLDVPPSVIVKRKSGRRPYHVIAAPLRRTLRPFTGMTAPSMLVLITDPELRRLAPPEVLKHAYALTRKEAMLALTLAEGQTLEQAAERLDIRYETARTHLRRVLMKTDTSRQAELVMLLERLSCPVSKY